LEKVGFKNSPDNLILVFLLFVLISGQEKTIQYNLDGWCVLANTERETIIIKQKDLDIVLKDIRLNIKKDNKLLKLSGFSFKTENEKIIIFTKEPYETTWEFNINEERIYISCSRENAVITGIAQASESRIPARVAELDKMHTFVANEDFTGTYFEEKFYIPSKASHVMYTALGFVDALNIHSLFDRKTNTVIQFPKESKLTRNTGDATLMDVEIPVISVLTSLKLIPDYYTKVLGMTNYIPYDDTHHKVAPTGWNHWLAFYREVTEDDVVRHTDWIALNLKDYGFLHVQLDDGYNHPEHRCWYKDWDKGKFPHGPKWLANYIKSKGFIPGLWTVPYCYCVEHGKPEWFLRDKNGNIPMDYQGGGELDFSREDVIRNYWIPLLDSLKNQGWEYYKFDMGSTVPICEEYHEQFYDISKSCYDISHKTMKIFREIMGPEIWHTTHPDKWGGRMGFVDVVGCGSDPGPGWELMQNFFEVISNNTYQNHIVWYSDPDCCVIRGEPTRVDIKYGHKDFITLEEARTAVSLISLTGLQFLSGDDLTNLSKERLELIKRSMPITPIFPIDLFGRGRDPRNYPTVIDLKVNAESGIYDVISVTNWQDTSAYYTVKFEEDLGLSDEYSYLVFDFWKQKLLGIFENKFVVELLPHGTRVFTIIHLLNRPQLLATSRHITGTYSIKSLDWDTSNFTLSGTSATIPGALYSLFIYVSENMNITEVRSTALKLSHKLNLNGLFEISFIGQKELVNWTVKFGM
jgi:hypothetical protein